MRPQPASPQACSASGLHTASLREPFCTRSARPGAARQSIVALTRIARSLRRAPSKTAHIIRGHIMARRKNRAEILADIEDLKKQLAESEEREERRIGKLANKAGLLDLKISDEELAKASGERAARFRQDGQGTGASQSAPRPTAQAGANGAGAWGCDRR